MPGTPKGLDAEASKASFQMVGFSLGPGQPCRSPAGYAQMVAYPASPSGQSTLDHVHSRGYNAICHLILGAI